MWVGQTAFEEQYERLSNKDPWPSQWLSTICHNQSNGFFEVVDWQYIVQGWSSSNWNVYDYFKTYCTIWYSQWLHVSQCAIDWYLGIQCMHVHSSLIWWPAVSQPSRIRTHWQCMSGCLFACKILGVLQTYCAFWTLIRLILTVVVSHPMCIRPGTS